MSNEKYQICNIIDGSNQADQIERSLLLICEKWYDDKDITE